MGDTTVRRPVASHFEKGVDFGLIVHKSPFMADEKDPLVLSNYIFELLEVNPGVAGFLIQLHPDDVDAVVESVTAHAEKGAGTKTTLYVKNMCEMRLYPSQPATATHPTMCAVPLSCCTPVLLGNGTTQPHTAKCVPSHEHRAVQRCILSPLSHVLPVSRAQVPDRTNVV